MLPCMYVALVLCSLGLHHDPLAITSSIVVGEEPAEVSRKSSPRCLDLKHQAQQLIEWP